MPGPQVPSCNLRYRPFTLCVFARTLPPTYATGSHCPPHPTVAVPPTFRTDGCTPLRCHRTCHSNSLCRTGYPPAVAVRVWLCLDGRDPGPRPDTQHLYRFHTPAYLPTGSPRLPRIYPILTAAVLCSWTATRKHLLRTRSGSYCDRTLLPHLVWTLLRGRAHTHAYTTPHLLTTHYTFLRFFSYATHPTFAHTHFTFVHFHHTALPFAHALVLPFLPFLHSGATTHRGLAAASCGDVPVRTRYPAAPRAAPPPPSPPRGLCNLWTILFYGPELPRLTLPPHYAPGPLYLTRHLLFDRRPLPLPLFYMRRLPPLPGTFPTPSYRLPHPHHPTPTFATYPTATWRICSLRSTFGSLVFSFAPAFPP